MLYYFGLTERNIWLQQEAETRIQVLQSVLSNIEDYIVQNNISDMVVKEFKGQINRRINILTTQISPTPFSTLSDEYIAMRKLLNLAFKTERETLLKLRKLGQISDDVFHRLSDELDLEELRAKTMRI